MDKKSHFYGKTIVLTGTLSAISRHEARVVLTGCGARVAVGVTKKTDLVIVGSDPGTKREKAEQLGIKVMLEDEFLVLIKKR